MLLKSWQPPSFRNKQNQSFFFKYVKIYPKIQIDPEVLHLPTSMEDLAFYSFQFSGSIEGIFIFSLKIKN